MHFLNENAWILLEISLKFVPNVRRNNISSLVQIMAWRRPGDKPLSGPMMVSLLTHICVSRPQWVNFYWCLFPRVQLTISNCYLRQGCAKQVTSHYMNQWWPNFITAYGITGWETKFFGTRPNCVVSYIAYTKFHSPRPVFHSPGQIFTRIGEWASASFPAWNQ